MTTVNVTFISYEGIPHTVEVPVGINLMRAATEYGVAGIDGDCGGNCACGTCHIFVDAEWLAQLDDANAMEQDMLGFAPELKDNSRLACQIMLSEALDGLTVSVPESQF